MDFERVLAHVQAQFPGQLVLYAPDIAKILGKSESAIEHLMTRKNLPFQVKSVGRGKCVDIFQVAQWLSTDQTMAQEVAEELPEPKASKALRTTSQRTRTAKSTAASQGVGQGPKTAEKAPMSDEDYGPFARMILERRKAEAIQLQGFALGLGDLDNTAFILEVLDALVSDSTLSQSVYLVTLDNLAPQTPGLLASSSKRYFDDKQAAQEFAHERLTEMHQGRVMAGTQIRIEYNNEIVFWCAHSKEFGILVINNAMELPLPAIVR